MEESIEDLVDEMECKIRYFFGPLTQIRTPEIAEDVRKVFEEEGMLGPVMAYFKFKSKVLRSPDPENVKKLNDLYELHEYSIGPSSFLRKLKEYSN